MSSQTPAYVRTGTPMAAGALLVYIARQLGLDLSTDQATLLVPAVMYAYYVLGRALEHLNPTLGYVLGIAKQPAYSSKKPPQPEPPLTEDAPAEKVRQWSESLPQTPDAGNDQPVQTDNRPRDEDGEPLDERSATLGATWTGQEMR